MEVWIGLLVLGVLVGAYGTLIGAGGGFVLVPLLLLLYPRDNPNIITAISLAVVLVNAASGTVAYVRMKRINYRAGAIFAVATVPGAIVGALVIRYIPRVPFSIVMSAVLMAIGVILSLRPRTTGVSADKTPDRIDEHDIAALSLRHGRSWPDFPFNKTLGVAISLAVGFVSSTLGVGGGIVHVPASVSLLRFPVYVATATSLFALVFTALAATVVHLFDGTLAGTMDRVVPLAVGVIPGAQLGAFLATKVHGLWILRALGVALGLVGVRLLIHAL